MQGHLARTVLIGAVFLFAGSTSLAGAAALPHVRLVAGAEFGDVGFTDYADDSQASMVALGERVRLTVIEESMTVKMRDGFITVFGEVRNDRDNAVAWSSLRMVALDAEGEILDTARTMIPASVPFDWWWASAGNLIAPGASAFFIVTLDASPDVVETVLVGAHGTEVDSMPGEVTLELIGDWEVHEETEAVVLSGRVRNPTTVTVAGLSVMVVARAPSGSVLTVGRAYPQTGLIGGYLGGLRPEDETDVIVILIVDPGDFASADLTTVATGRPYGGGWFRYGVAGLAHSPGAEGAVWRSSLTLTNRSGAAAGVALRYQHADGHEEVTLELSDGETFHREDVVRSFFGVTEPSAGYVQITASAPLMVSGRTSNETPTGGFGQALPVFTPEMTIELVGGGVLSGLRGGGVFRTNIGLVNMGFLNCTCSVRLFDPNGDLVWERTDFEVEPTTWFQLNDVVPADVEVGHAVVEPSDNQCWMWTYASVIEQASGDPTTSTVKFPTEIDLSPSSGGSARWMLGSWADQEVPEPPR